MSDGKGRELKALIPGFVPAVDREDGRPGASAPSSAQRSNVAAPASPPPQSQRLPNPDLLGGYRSFKSQAVVHSDESSDDRRKQHKRREKEGRKRETRERHRKRRSHKRSRSRDRKRAKGESETRASTTEAVVAERENVPRAKLGEDDFKGRPTTSSAIVSRREEFRSKVGGPRCYFLDTHADGSNVAFGSLFSKDVPLYRRFHGGFRHSSMGAQASKGSPQRTALASSTTNAARFFSRATKRLREAKPVHRDLDGSFSHPPASTQEVGFIPLEEDPPSDSDEEQDVLDSVQKRVRLLNEAVRKEPNAIDRWMELIDFQDYLVELGLLDPGNATEKKISILAGAISTSPRSSEIRAQLVLRYLDIVSDRWSAFDADVAFEKALSDCPDVAQIWIKRVKHMLNSLSFFSFERSKELCLRGILALSRYPDAEQECWELAFALYRIHFAMGYTEQSIGLSQALLEFQLFAPELEGPGLDVQQKQDLFRAFWKSGAARLGEQNSIGWGKWSIEVRKRLSGFVESSSSSAKQKNSTKPPPPSSSRPPPPPPKENVHAPPSHLPPPQPPPPPSERSGENRVFRPIDQVDGLPLLGQPYGDRLPSEPQDAKLEKEVDQQPDAEDDDTSKPSGEEHDEWTDTDENEWSASSDEDDEIQKVVADAYRDQEANIAEDVQTWVEAETSTDKSEWLPIKDPRRVGLGIGDIAIKDALRAAERIVSASDVAIVGHLPSARPQYIRRVFSDLVGSMTGACLWKWGFDTLPSDDELQELSNFSEHPSITIAARLNASPHDRQVYETAYELLSSGANLDHLKQIQPEKADFIMNATRSLCDRRPDLFGSTLIRLSGLWKGPSAAKSVAKRLLKRNPKLQDLYLDLAAVNERHGSEETAQAVYRQVLLSSPEQSSTYTSAVWDMMRLHVPKLEAGKDAGEQLLSAIYAKKDVSKTDVVKFRRTLEDRSGSAQKEKPVPSFGVIFSRLMFEAIVVSLPGALSLSQVLIEQFPGQHRLIHYGMVYTALFAKASAASPTGETNHILRAALQSGLEQNPEDSWLLGVLLSASMKSPQTYSSRFFYKLTTASPNAVGPYIVAAHLWNSREQGNRAQGALDRCVSRTGSKSMWAWRQLVRTVKPGERRRREFLRGVAKCAWCKEFWTSSLVEMRDHLSRAELSDILGIIEEKGVLVRISFNPKPD